MSEVLIIEKPIVQTLEISRSTCGLYVTTPGQIVIIERSKIISTTIPRVDLLTVGTPGPQGIKGDKGDQGDPGTDGQDGSDANVTKENVEAVLTGTITSHDHDLAAMNDDSTHRLVTDAEKTSWNAKIGSSNSTIANIIKLTQAEYDALSPNYSATTLYIVSG